MCIGDYVDFRTQGSPSLSHVQITVQSQRNSRAATTLAMHFWRKVSAFYPSVFADRYFLFNSLLSPLFLVRNVFSQKLYRTLTREARKVGLKPRPMYDALEHVLEI